MKILLQLQNIFERNNIKTFSQYIFIYLIYFNSEFISLIFLCITRFSKHIDQNKNEAGRIFEIELHNTLVNFV